MEVYAKHVTEALVKQELDRINDRIADLYNWDTDQRRQNIISLVGSLRTMERLGLIDRAKIKELCAMAQARDTDRLIQEEDAMSDEFIPE